jgi:hypothetical protein
MNLSLSSTLSIEAWTSRAKKHDALIHPITDAFLKRRGLGQTHAVHDFLFTYYSCSPLKLKQWVPSFEEELEMTDSIRQDYSWLTDYWFSLNEGMLSLRKERIHKSARAQARFIADLCANISQRAPRFGCYGLHEWAMVYKESAEALRHKDYLQKL